MAREKTKGRAFTAALLLLCALSAAAALLPGVERWQSAELAAFPFRQAGALLRALSLSGAAGNPLHNICNVPKVIVKCLAGDPARFHQILHCNFIRAPSGDHFHHRVRDSAFHIQRHGPAPSPVGLYPLSYRKRLPFCKPKIRPVFPRRTHMAACAASRGFFSCFYKFFTV